MNQLSTERSNCNCQNPQTHSIGALMKDPIYAAIANRLKTISETKALFYTDAGIKRKHFAASLPENIKNRYKCSKCSDFFRKYGSLAYIEDSGRLVSALWEINSEVHSQIPEVNDSLTSLAKQVSRSQITGTFSPVLGVVGGEIMLEGKHIGTKEDNFPHFHGKLDETYIRNHHLGNYDMIHGGAKWLANRIGLDNAQRHLKKLSVFADAERNISVEHKKRINCALKIVEELQGIGKPLHIALPILMNKCHNNPELQSTIHALPHLGGSFLGAAINALQNGQGVQKALADVVTRTAIDNYKARDISKVTSNQLTEGMKEFEKEELMGALDRKMATVDDIPFVWKKPMTATKDALNPFELAGAKVNGELDKPLVEKAIAVSVSKFLTKILPDAISCKVKFGHSEPLFRLNTPKTDCKGIFKWDLDEERRPYCTIVGSRDINVTKYGLHAGWNDVAQVSPTPWTDSTATKSSVSNLDPTMLFLVEGKYLGGSESNVSSYGTALKANVYKHRIAVDAALANTRIAPVTNPAIGLAMSVQMDKEVFVRIETAESIKTYKVVGIE